MARIAEDTTLEALELRLRSILPEQYQDRYDDVRPVSMGSAGLKFGADGSVAWNEMWATFCDLAMAGGPPHKGTLLQPGSATEIAAQPHRYRQVVEEICRGISLVSGLMAEQSPTPGWIRVNCTSCGMAEWLVRAIAMENVSVRSCEGATIDLPAGPDYRIEKEIKNVITVIAKTCHYWNGHIPVIQQRAIASLFARMDAASPFVQPAVLAGKDSPVGYQKLYSTMAQAIQQATGLPSSHHAYTGWLGLVCPDTRSAVWMMRMMVASNLLARREGTVFFLPVNPGSDPDGAITTRNVIRLHRLRRDAKRPLSGRLPPSCCDTHAPKTKSRR